MKIPTPAWMAEAIEALHSRLDDMEEKWGDLVRADQRFSVGDHVELGTLADRRYLTGRLRSRKGVVKAINGYRVSVLMPGHARPVVFHHMFLELAGAKEEAWVAQGKKAERRRRARQRAAARSVRRAA